MREKLRSQREAVISLPKPLDSRETVRLDRYDVVRLAQWFRTRLSLLQHGFYMWFRHVRW